MRRNPLFQRLLTPGTLAFAAGVLLFAAPAAHAITIVPECARSGNVNAADLNCALQTFQNVARMIIGITGSVALFFFVYGGFTLLTSRGIEAEVTKGKTIIKNAVIGIILIFLAFYVVDYFSTTLRGRERNVEGQACYGGAGKFVRIGMSGDQPIIECKLLCANVQGYTCQTNPQPGSTCTNDYYCPGSTGTGAARCCALPSAGAATP